MAYITAGEILNRVVGETGLAEESSDPYASQDPTFAQLRRLLQSAAGDLLNARMWPQFTSQYQFTTVAGQTDYSLPSDFRGMLYSTGWNRTTRTPLAGPATPSQWERVLIWYGANSTLSLIFKVSPQSISVLPPPPDGVVASYEYVSGNWVAPQGQSKPTASAPTASSDVVWFDDLLIVRALKLKFLQARGFDTTVAMREYLDSLGAAMSRSGSAPKLSLYRRQLPQGSHTVGEAAGGAADPFSAGVLY